MGGCPGIGPTFPSPWVTPRALHGSKNIRFREAGKEASSSGLVTIEETKLPSAIHPKHGTWGPAGGAAPPEGLLLGEGSESPRTETSTPTYAADHRVVKFDKVVPTPAACILISIYRERKASQSREMVPYAMKSNYS